MFIKEWILRFLILVLLQWLVCSSKNVSPNVTCPNNIITYSRYTKPVTWDPPTVTDDVDNDLVATCTPLSGSSFNSGSSRTIKCNATDSSGNTDECNFTVRIFVADVTVASIAKPAYQSTTYTYSGVTYDANLALDGSINTCSRTIVESNPYWYVDLGLIYSVNYVVIYPAVGYEETLIDTDVHASTSTSSLFDDNNLCGSTSLERLSSKGSYKVDCINTLISGQYVSISKMGNNDIMLCNVQVYVDITRCLSDPCQNGGTCIDFVNRFECNCTSGWDGETCGIDAAICGSNPCMNAGSCSSQQDEFNCTCLSGFSGSFCEINIDECASNPCYNNGTCIDDVYGYICQCSGGWTGFNCDQDSENPNVICPSDIEQSSDVDLTTVTWSEPSVTDNVDTDLSATCTPPSGSLFDIGSTDVNCSTMDTDGNTGICAFTLTISGSSVPGYKIVVIMVIVIILVMFAAFVIYRVRSPPKSKMKDSTKVVNAVDRDYEIRLPTSDFADVAGHAVPAAGSIVPTRPTVTKQTYSTIEPEYIELIMDYSSQKSTKKDGTHLVNTVDSEYEIHLPTSGYVTEPTMLAGPIVPAGPSVAAEYIVSARSGVAGGPNVLARPNVSDHIYSTIEQPEYIDVIM